jgi:hypothetical protein
MGLCAGIVTGIIALGFIGCSGGTVKPTDYLTKNLDKNFVISGISINDNSISKTDFYTDEENLKYLTDTAEEFAELAAKDKLTLINRKSFRFDSNTKELQENKFSYGTTWTESFVKLASYTYSDDYKISLEYDENVYKYMDVVLLKDAIRFAYCIYQKNILGNYEYAEGYEGQEDYRLVRSFVFTAEVPVTVA